MSRPSLSARIGLIACLFAAGATAQPRLEGGTLRGQVMDETDAVIPGAEVTITGPGGETRTVTAGLAGEYEAAGLPAGRHSVRATAPELATPRDVEINIVPGGEHTLNLALQVVLGRQEITVEDQPAGEVSVDPYRNVGAIVLRGADLEALSDDPDELAEELQALAGPSAGPSGGQIFVDGFSRVRIPPKASIREIRINTNPFSAEHDSLGFGRIEIFTKPGSDSFHGDLDVRFSDESFNSRNPFAANRAPYQMRDFGGNVGGPLGKNASFFVDFSRREIDGNAVINATILDTSLLPLPFSQAVVTPTRRTEFSPRLDYQLSRNHTVTGRYRYSRTSDENSGIGEFSLPSVAYERLMEDHALQLIETAVINATTINETRLQFTRNRSELLGDNTIPTINVLEAFRDGGAQVGHSTSTMDNWEIQNLTTKTAGAHMLKFGARVRTSSISDIAPRNFGGTFTFSGGFAPELDANDRIVLDASRRPVTIPITSLERYRRTLLFLEQGLSGEETRLLGGGASQFSIAGGAPSASVSQVDLGLFLMDDWRVRPNFSLSLGLRYETQNNIRDRANFAPRVGFAWAPGRAGGRPGKTVIRGGAGIFYSRVDEDLTLQTLRFDGILQQQHIVQNPGFYPLVPDIGSLADQQAPQTIRQLAEDARAPYLIQTAIGVERQLPYNTTLGTTYTFTRGVNLLRSRNINAPLPDTGLRPYGTENIFQYEATGFLRQNQLITNVRTQFHGSVSLFGFYAVNKAMSDTDGVMSFPANQYDLSGEWGRSSLDIRHRIGLGGSITAPLGLRLNPFVMIHSGAPFNITTGADDNGDLVFTDRPALSSDLTAPGVILSRFGVFDPSPGSGSDIVPRNFGQGPWFKVFNLRLSRTFGFGGPRGERPDEVEGPRGGLMTGRGPGGGGGGGRGPGSFFFGPGGSGENRYSLTFSIAAQNVLNMTNPGTPIGNLSSPLFGESNSLAGFGRMRSSAANRSVTLQMRFSF